MRYIMSLALAALLLVPAFSTATAARGGFNGPTSGTANVMTVDKAKTLPDDAWVALQGNIVSRLPNSHDEYIFRDSTGEVQVEISDKVFRGQNVSPTDRVSIAGEVDRDRHGSFEIEVKRLEVLN